MGGDAEQRALAGPCWVGESATSRVCFLPLASGLAARTRQAAWGCLAVESLLWELRSSSRVGLVREPNCSDINKKICCDLITVSRNLNQDFFLCVDTRLPHPQQFCWISSVDLSVLSLLWATPVYRRGCCFAESGTWNLIKSSLSSLPPHQGAS